MATAATSPELLAAAPTLERALRRPPRSLWSNAWGQFRRHRLAVAGLCVFFILLLTTLIGPLVYRTSPDALDVSASLIGPSAQHPFGTDDLGHDLLARTLIGGRVSMAVGVVAVLIALTLGTLIGAIAGFFGGIIDNVLMRITDMFIGIPQLPLLLLVIFLFRDALRSVFGPELGIFVMIVAVIGALN
jgi:peptide/nickel transport system permease protein